MARVPEEVRRVLPQIMVAPSVGVPSDRSSSVGWRCLAFRHPGSQLLRPGKTRTPKTCRTLALEARESAKAGVRPLTTASGIQEFSPCQCGANPRFTPRRRIANQPQLHFHMESARACRPPTSRPADSLTRWPAPVRPPPAVPAGCNPESRCHHRRCPRAAARPARPHAP